MSFLGFSRELKGCGTLSLPLLLIVDDYVPAITAVSEILLYPEGSCGQQLTRAHVSCQRSRIQHMEAKLTVFYPGL